MHTNTQCCMRPRESEGALKPLVHSMNASPVIYNPIFQRPVPSDGKSLKIVGTFFQRASDLERLVKNEP